ncbi:fatty acid oxidation complex alpha subunit [gamma proteobacterium HTCC5015]|nr:fatty acid oxidation complex alpha subunit [gamma proteobacterium HTCC5015]
MTAVRFEKDADHIVTLTIDVPGVSANIMNADYRQGMTAAIEQLEADIGQQSDSVAGVIIASAKSTFFAGGDLNELVAVEREQSDEFLSMLSQQITGPLRRLETLGKPVVAAINGTALGGGWEICLACHHRIAIDSPKIQLGLPEVQLGLLPGGGGVTRMTRLLGLEAAFPYLLEGKQLRPQAALEAGLVHELADSPEDLIDKAKAFIKAHPESAQPWDQKGYRLPGGKPQSPAMAPKLSIAPSILRQKTKGVYPAPEAIMAAATEGAQVDFDTAQQIESRYFMSLVLNPVAKSMIHTLWFQLNEVKAGASRPDGIERSQFSKVGVLGAGMMGAGIAYACANRGIPVVLKDVSQDNAERGKGYSEKLLDKKLKRGFIDEARKQATLDLITATDSAEDLAGCDLVIEAVLEDQSLKAKVTQEAEAQLADNGVFASNTSTLPITDLAQASQKPEHFIGLHFFSPVDKMPLVEIICGEQTNDETLARAYDFVQQIGKTPIVVNDSRGFFTSRVFGTFINEGIAMLAEGQAPAAIEQAALQGGMPVGALAITDEVSLTLPIHIRSEAKKAQEAEGKSYTPHPADAVLDRMVEEFQRVGKAKGAGFYDYPENGKKTLWEGLSAFQNGEATLPFEDLRDRILFIQSIETVRCLEEGVLTSSRDANIGSIMGIGFPAWTGGALQYINQYGVAEFCQRAEQLAERYGDRFALPELLKSKAQSGEGF